MKTEAVLKEVIELFKNVDTDKSEMVFKCNGNTLYLDSIEKPKNSNRIVINLKATKK